MMNHVSQRLARDPDADAHALAAFEALVASSLPERTSNPGGAGRTTEPPGGEHRCVPYVYRTSLPS
jgi:hypothetical protein